jgi:hypothetical protein
MIESRFQGGYPAKLKEKLNQAKSKSFADAIDILERYFSTERVRVPPFLASDRDLTKTTKFTANTRAGTKTTEVIQ